MEERHDNEQYFFDQATADALADLLEPLGRACVLCAPALGIELKERGCDPVILDNDERFNTLRGFRRWDIHRPTRLVERFDVIFCDPPTFSNSKHNASYDWTRTSCSFSNGMTTLITGSSWCGVMADITFPAKV